MSDAPREADPPAENAPIWVVVTELRDERCAFAVDAVLEVFPLERWTPVPGSPPFVIGVLGRRGAAYGVLDIGLLREVLRGGTSSAGRAAPLGTRGQGLLLRTPAGGLVVCARQVAGLAAAERCSRSEGELPDPLAPSFVSVDGSPLRLYDAAQLETIGRAELRAVALSARA